MDSIYIYIVGGSGGGGDGDSGVCASGPLTRYVKLRVTHAPGMPGTFSPPPTLKEAACYRS